MAKIDLKGYVLYHILVDLLLGLIVYVFGYLIIPNLAYRKSFLMLIIAMAISTFFGIALTPRKEQSWKNIIEDGLCGVAFYLLIVLLPILRFFTKIVGVAIIVSIGAEIYAIIKYRHMKRTELRDLCKNVARGALLSLSLGIIATICIINGGAEIDPYVKNNANNSVMYQG